MFSYTYLDNNLGSFNYEQDFNLFQKSEKWLDHAVSLEVENAGSFKEVKYLMQHAFEFVISANYFDFKIKEYVANELFRSANELHLELSGYEFKYSKEDFKKSLKIDSISFGKNGGLNISLSSNGIFLEKTILVNYNKEGLFNSIELIS